MRNIIAQLLWVAACPELWMKYGQFRLHLDARKDLMQVWKYNA